MKIIDESSFRALLERKLESHFDRAFTVWKNYGPKLSGDVTNVMLHAADKSKEDEILTILEKHWNDHLQYQHPEARGLITNFLNVNPTELIFRRICIVTLELTPDGP